MVKMWKYEQDWHNFFHYAVYDEKKSVYYLFKSVRVYLKYIKNELSTSV